MAIFSKKISKNYLWLAGLQALNFLLPFMVLPFIVPMIGPMRFGWINYMLAIQMWYVLVINFGFDYAGTQILKGMTYPDCSISKLFWQIFLARILLCAFCFIITLLLLPYIYQLKISGKLTAWTLIACIAFIIQPNWLFQTYEQLPKATVFTVMGKSIFCIGVLLMVRRPEDFWKYAAVTAVSQIIAAVCAMVYAIRKFGIKWVPPSLVAVRKLIFSTKHVFLITILPNIFIAMNTLILGIYVGGRGMGYFTSAVRVLQVVQALMIVPLSQTIFPSISNAFNIGQSAGYGLLKRYFPMLLLIGLLGSLMTFVTAPYVVKILFGPAFMPTVSLLRLMSVLPFFFCLNNYLGMQCAVNIHRDNKLLLTYSIACVCNIVLNLLLDNRLGIVGACFAWIFSEMILSLLLYILLRRQGLFSAGKN